MAFVLGGCSQVLQGVEDPLQVPVHLDASDPRSKISSQVRAVLDHEVQSTLAAARLRAISVPTRTAGCIALRLDLEPSHAALTALTSLGVVIDQVSPRWNCVMVEATPAQVAALAHLDSIHGIALVRGAVRHNQPGTYANQADAVIHSDQVRALHAVSGSGRTIGVISDSINDTPAVGGGTITGAHAPYQLSNTNPQRAGNLPANISVVDFGTPSNGHSDEGEALIEEIYHLAPGAGYAFSADGGSQTGMAANIAVLQGTVGCTLICDDLTFLDEPMFQDGPIAQAAEAFVASGGVYLAAAGNTSDAGISTPFTLDPLSQLHDWGGGLGDYLPITLGPGITLTIVLQWSQPFHSFNLGPGAQTDLDLALYSIAGTHPSQLVAASADTQGTSGAPSGDPVELLQFTNPGTSSATYDLAIPYHHGPTTIALRLVASVSSGSVSSADYAFFGAATTYGHATGEGVLAIGAVDWRNPAVLESYSAKGGWGAAGIPFYFDRSGNLLANAPVMRNKPDLIAPDGVHTSVFGSMVSGDPTGLPSFFGTSSATGNATAAAALAWCVHPALSGTQLTQVLQATATDLTTLPAGPGPDAWSGYGLINALTASSALVSSITSTARAGTYITGTIPLELTFSTPVTVDVSQGVPTIHLNSSSSAVATYVGGSGTTQLSFTYVIAAGDDVLALDVASSSALTLNGGIISVTTADRSPMIPILPTSGQPGSLPASTTLTIAAVGPSIAISAQPPSYHLPTFVFTVTFQRPVLGFSASDLVVTNGSLVGGSVTAQSDGLSYTCTVTAQMPGLVTVGVPAGSVIDSAYGYPNLAGVGSADYDITPPTLVITPSMTVVENNQDLMLNFTWSKSVVGFTSADIHLVDSDGTQYPLEGSGAHYQLKIIAGAPGILSIIVPAGVVSDLAGNLQAEVSVAEVEVVKGPLPSDQGGHSSCGFGSSGAVVLMGGLLGCRRWRSRRRHGPVSSPG